MKGKIMNWRRFLTRILNVISTITMLLVMLSAMFMGLMLAPTLTGHKAYVVLTGSMEPAIGVGAVILIDSKTNLEKLEVGNIITYQYADIQTPITHRIVEIHEDGYKTKGDANTARDAAIVGNGDILGKVIIAVPYLGYTIFAIQSKVGKVCIFYLICIHILTSILKNKK